MHLYIHVPFCRRRCSYCDFAIAVRRRVPGGAFVDAVAREYGIRTEGCRGGETARTDLETLYLGGGTPSLLGPGHIADLVRFVREEIGLAAGAEVTLEANPDDVTERSVDAWLAAGVNRVSLGVQSLDDDVLSWMHRTHSAAQGLEALRALGRCGVPSISVDVIFALPRGRTVLDRILECEPHHVSAYGLTVEPRTPLFHWVQRGTTPAVEPERYAEEFLAVRDRLRAAGYEHYEISNYARPGHRSAHNQAYWQGHPYTGLGPSAHSYTGHRARPRVRRWNSRHWVAYQRMVGQGVDPVDGEERLTAKQRRMERLLLGLRTSEGLAPDEAGPLCAARVEQAVEQGWLVVGENPDGPGRTGNVIRATPEGWLRVDSLVRVLTTSGEGG